MFQYVRPAKLLAALQWLTLNNALYKDIETNDDWTGAAEANFEWSGQFFYFNFIELDMMYSNNIT